MAKKKEIILELKALSIQEMEKKLKKLTKEWKKLSETERESPIGVETKKQISEVSKAIDNASGSAERNIEKYKGLNRDFIGVIKALNPELGGLIERFQSSEIYARTLGKTTDWLTKTFKISASSAMLLQLGLGALVAVGVYALIKAFKEYKKEQEEVARLNGIVSESLKSASIEGQKNARKELTNLELLYNATQDHTKSKKERLKAVGQLQKLYPQYLGNLSKEEVMAGKGKAAYDNLTNAIIESAKARAYAEKIAENQSKIIDLEIKKAEKQEELVKKEATLVALRNTSYDMYSPGQTMLQNYSGGSTTDEIKSINKEISDATLEIGKINDANSKLAEKINTSALIDSSNSDTNSDNSSKTGVQEEQEQRALEDAQVDAMKDGLDKMRAETEKNFKRQIEDLKKRLKEEGNLSVKAREAINEQIKIIEENKAKTLASLSDKAWQEESDKYLEHLNKQLSLIDENSKEAFELKKQMHEKELEMALKEAEKIGLDPELVKAKYQAEAQKLEEERNAAHVKALLDVERKGFEERLKATLEAGKTEQEAKLQLKREEFAQMKQIEGESDADFKQRKEAAAKELKEFEAARLQEMIDGGLTENQAKLQLKQEELEGMTQLEGESDEHFMLRQLEREEEAKALKQKVFEDELDTTSAKVKVYQQMFDDMGSILEEFGANSAALGVFSKAMALAEIGINTAKAISAGVASAQTVPFPGNIAAVVTTIGTIMANVANAKKLLSKEKTPEAPKFATGGLVSGEGSGTSDSVNARLSNGESVITAMGTQMFGPMLSAFNQLGGGVPITATNTAQQAIGQEMLTEAFRKALNTMPSPVVSVTEINDVNRRVDVLESYGTL